MKQVEKAGSWLQVVRGENDLGLCKYFTEGGFSPNLSVKFFFAFAKWTDSVRVGKFYPDVKAAQIGNKKVRRLSWGNWAILVRFIGEYLPLLGVGY